MYYILDIETKPNPKLLDVYMQNIKAPSNYKTKEAIEKYMKTKEKEARKNMSVDTDYAEIFCIWVKKRQEDGKWWTNLMTLEEFIPFMWDMSNEDVFVTFNWKKFDLPVLLKAHIKNKEIRNVKLLNRMMKRYNAEQHIDLMEIISNYDKPKSLDTYLQIYLGIKKKEIDFDTCEDDELCWHCVEDLENTAKLFTLFKPII